MLKFKSCLKHVKTCWNSYYMASFLFTITRLVEEYITICSLTWLLAPHFLPHFLPIAIRSMPLFCISKFCSYAELQRIFKIMLPINLKGLHLMRTISQSLTQRTLVIHWKCSIEVYNSFHSTNQMAPFNKLAYAMWPAAGCKVPTCNLSTFDVTTCNMAITVAGYDSSVQPIRLFRSFNSPRQCYRICNMWWLQGPHL